MMNRQIPLLGRSLEKVLSTAQGAFNKARIKILFTILLLSLVKVFVVIAVAAYHGQDFQLARGIFVLVLYSTLIRFLLTDQKYVEPITHVMICVGILLVWTNVFITVQFVNVITLQFIFMAIVSSFYFLNQAWGILYSILSTLPVIIYYLLAGTGELHLGVAPNMLAPIGTFMVMLLNFVTIITAHYLYHDAFSANVAEKVSLNEQLKKAVDVANKHAQSKSDFLSTMSHELRTPLNSVIGITDLLLDDPYNEEQKEKLKILSFSAVSLHALINDILDFNKLDSDKLQLETISVNLNDLMKSICSGLEVHAKEKGLSLVRNIDEEISRQHIITDPTRITQIIYNLAGNGIKFTNSGSVTISLKVLDKDTEKIRIGFAVSDTGIGISADKHDTIFEPFVQASSNTTRNFGGTGLGLSIVKHLLTLFGSSIRLESAYGKGSTFSFDITFLLDQKPVVSDVTLNESDYDLTGLRVLVAEDNQMNIFLVKKLCAKWNIEPVIAENGIEVIDKLSSGTYDVILMDIHMPEMDGYEATGKIRSLPDRSKAEIPIIALTATVSHDMSTRIKEVGMNDFVRKPFNARELYGKLKSIPPMAAVS